MTSGMMMSVEWWHLHMAALSLAVCGAGIAGAGAVTRIAFASRSQDRSRKRHGACAFGASLLFGGVALGAVELIIRYWHM